MIKKFNEYIKEANVPRYAQPDFCVLYDRGLEIREYIDSKLNPSLNEVFYDAQVKYNSSGDISPEQSLKLDKLENSLLDIIYEQVSQNIEDVDLEFLRNDFVDIDVLKDLTDERDSCREGSDVIGVYYKYLTMNWYQHLIEKSK